MEKYVAFIAQIRRVRRETPILVLVSQPNGYTCAESKEDQIRMSAVLSALTREVCSKAGGEQNKVYLCVVDPEPSLDYSSSSDWGSLLHWSVQGSEKWAQGVIPHVSSIMKWEPIKYNNR